MIPALSSPIDTTLRPITTEAPARPNTDIPNPFVNDASRRTTTKAPAHPDTNILSSFTIRRITTRAPVYSYVKISNSYVGGAIGRIAIGPITGILGGTLRLVTRALVPTNTGVPGVLNPPTSSTDRTKGSHFWTAYPYNLVPSFIVSIA